MDMSSREIRMPLSEVVSVLQDLNEFVVSLDRLDPARHPEPPTSTPSANSSPTGMSLGDWPAPDASSALSWMHN
jgi:hypothetical protein